MPATQTAQSAQSQPSDLAPKIARFAPTDIAADVSKLSPPDRRALAKLIEASKVLDGIYLRQVWVGNEAMLIDLARDESPAGRDRLHYFLINKGPWSRIDHNEPFVPGAPPKPPGANFYPAGATKEEIEKWIRSLPEADRARATGFFTVIRRAANGQFTAVPYSVEYQNELAHAAALLREAADLSAEPTLKAFLTKRARGVPVQRLLRQRRRLDGAQGCHRADHWTLRGLRGRVLQLQGGIRVVHHPSRRCRVGQADAVRRRAAGYRERAADRREVSQPEARGAGAADGRQRRVHRRRREPRRADRGLQPAERRAGVEGKRRQARHAQERAGRKVREGARPDLEGRPCRRRSEEHRVRRVLHAHPDARADARPRPAQHHRRGPRHDRAPGDEGSVELPRGSEGRHLRPVCAPAPGRQGRPAEIDGTDDLHDVPGVGVPVDPLRRHRGPRQGHRDSAQLPPRPGRVRRSGTTAPSWSTPRRSRRA